MTTTEQADDLSPVELAATRRALGLTSGEVARHLGVARHTVSRWESGKECIPPARVGQIRDLVRLTDEFVQQLVHQAQTRVQEIADPLGHILRVPRPNQETSLPRVGDSHGWLLVALLRVSQQTGVILEWDDPV